MEAVAGFPRTYAPAQQSPVKPCGFPAVIVGFLLLATYRIVRRDFTASICYAYSKYYIKLYPSVGLSPPLILAT